MLLEKNTDFILSSLFFSFSPAPNVLILSLPLSYTLSYSHTLSPTLTHSLLLSPTLSLSRSCNISSLFCQLRVINSAESERPKHTLSRMQSVRMQSVPDSLSIHEIHLGLCFGSWRREVSKVTADCNSTILWAPPGGENLHKLVATRDASTLFRTLTTIITN